MELKKFVSCMEEVKKKYASIMDDLQEKREKYILVSMLLYKIALELFYIVVVSSLFDYEGLVNEGVGWKYFFSWVVYLWMAAILPKKKEGLAECFLHIQFLITVSPLIVFYALANQSTLYLLMVVAVVSLETYILNRGNGKKTGIVVNNIRGYTTVFMVVFIIGMYLLLVLYGGFYGLKAFDFTYLYRIRDYASYPVIMDYIFSWLRSTIIPFYILYCLEKKRYFCVAALTFLMLLMYMTLGNRIIYLSLLVIFSVYIVSRLRILVLGAYTGVSLGCISLTIMYLLEASHGLSKITAMGSALIGDRFLFGPAWNKFLYYKCFNDYPKVGFADGLIGRCFGLTYPFQGSMGQTVFAYFQNGRLFESNSNTGYLGDSYGQAGFLGMIVTGILVALFVKLLCNIGENLEMPLMCGLLALLAVLFNDSAFISIFFTSGWLILLFVLIIYAKPKGKVIKRREL